MSKSPSVRISRAGKEIGTFSPDEAIRLLSQGELLPTDYFWQAGMTNWERLSKLKDAQELRQRAESEERANREKSESGMREEDDEKLRRKVEEAVRERLAEERAKEELAKQGGCNLGLLGGALFAGGVVAVLLAYNARNNEQRKSDALEWATGSRRYTPIDSSGYDAFAFVAGAAALLGLALIIVGLSRKK
jgi:hypothetical protein